jgi:putative phage-type endonuclease
MTDTSELIQGSSEWKAARCGSLGASSLHEALARTKTGWGASRANLQSRLIIERLTGVPQETYQNAAMLTGIEREPEARNAYCFDQDCGVQEIGLKPHPSIKGTHASPDGLVIGVPRVLEIKCPQPAMHLETLLSGTIPEKYMLQMIWQMACCDAEDADYVSWNPDFPVEMRLFVRRVERDDNRIAQIEREVREFLSETDEKMEALRRKYAT